jgi:hypothetical protein
MNWSKNIKYSIKVSFICGIIWFIAFIFIIIFPFFIRNILLLSEDSIYFNILNVFFLIILFSQFIFSMLSIKYGLYNIRYLREITEINNDMILSKMKSVFFIVFGFALGIIGFILSILITLYIFSGGFAFF